MHIDKSLLCCNSVGPLFLKKSLLSSSFLSLCLLFILPHFILFLLPCLLPPSSLLAFSFLIDLFSTIYF